MINEKVKDLRFATKKLVTRLSVLAAIVVFGAIAIAQAQKGRDLSSLADPSTTSEKETSTKEGIQPQPIENHESSQIALASFDDNNEPTTESFDDGIAEPSEHDFQDLELPPARGADQFEQVDDPAIESNDNFEYEIPTDVPEEQTADSLDAGQVQEAAFNGENPYRDGDAGTELDEAPPLMEDDGTNELVFDDDTQVNDDTNLDYNDQDLLDAPDLTTDNTYQQEEEYGQLDQYESQTEVVPQDASSYAAPQDSLLDQNSAQSQFETNSLQDRQPTGSRYDISRRQEFGNNGIQRDTNFSATGRPGPQNLEGPQTPSLTIEKVAPPEIQVGKMAPVKIRVRNVGQVPADNVVIRDEVPEGTRLMEANPQPNSTAEGALLWDVGSINPGDEVVVTMELMPQAEGPIGSVATIAFQASASSRSRATKPELMLTHTSAEKVMVGDSVIFRIELSNPGSGTATHVVLEENVPAGLSHSTGDELKYEVGEIRPGQTRKLELKLNAAKAGFVTNTLVARADAGLMVKDTIELEVVAPQLEVGVKGPVRRYLEREATFTVSVSNPGTAAAKNVELIAQLPQGLKFVSLNNSGHYDRGRHAIIWSLEQLPSGEMGKAQFKAIPTAMGNYRIRAIAKADRELTSSQEHALAVEGLAALYFGLVDQTDPIEIGGRTTYILTVENQGSKTATNVRFVASVPPGLTAIAADGATPGVIREQTIVFEPIERLAPKAKTSFRIVVKGAVAGDHKLRVDMTSDEISTPVMKEENTRVFGD